MAKAKLPDRVFLSGFDLDISELEPIKKIINKYIKKINRICRYRSLNIRLKKTKKGTTFLHELTGRAETSVGGANTAITTLNLFKGTRDIMDKITHELEHKARKENKRTREK